MRPQRRIVSALACLAAAGCLTGAGEVAEFKPADPGRFGDYWYQGQAELTRYELEQSRYGESHRGDAVLIFVTEDFLPREQVKYEGRPASGEPRSVLKLNSTRKFYTGIYPYSIMTSVFTPVEGSRTYKASTSVQEWCGHVYQQLNLRDEGYRGLLHSYFQDEADQEIMLRYAMLEDEIWTRIRIAPDSLPVGDVRLIPGLHFARLMHRPTSVQRASASMSSTDDGQRSYRVEYRDIPRVLEIRFAAAFPYSIESWQERSGGQAGPLTRARKTHTVRNDYWNKNRVSDGGLREELGLD